jgi:hypothetical protein
LKEEFSGRARPLRDTGARLVREGVWWFVAVAGMERMLPWLLVLEAVRIVHFASVCLVMSVSPGRIGWLVMVLVIMLTGTHSSSLWQAAGLGPVAA